MKANKHKQFNVFDRVLVRDSEDKWQIDFYSYWNDEYKQHITLAYGDGLKIEDSDILHFEGNEHLLGSNDEPDEVIKLEEGEWMVFCDEETFDFRNNIVVGIFSRIDNDVFHLKHCYERFAEYAIRFSDFNPEDMEETRKHILCVKNGKIVRYKSN